MRPATPRANAVVPAWLPGRWWLLALAGWWLSRLAGLYAMRAFVDLDIDWGDLAVGLGLDAVWVTAMLAPARAAQQAKGAAPRIALTALTFALAFLSTTLRAFDLASCYFALAHMTVANWRHIDVGSLGYIHDPRLVLAIAGIALVALALTWLARRDGRHRPLSPAAAIATTATCVATAVATMAVAGWHPHHFGLLPELQAARTAWQAYGSSAPRVAPQDVRVTPLAPEVRRALTEAGVLAPGTGGDVALPLMRKDLGPLDALERRASSSLRGLAERDPQRRPPNVLIVLVESLSAGFTGLDPRARHADRMPALARFAAAHTSIQGFHNATSPTANGLIATFCATLPPSAVQDLEVGGSVDGQAPYRCLSDVLQTFGYRTEFARGASRVYMACEATLRSHGFDAVWGREDLSALYPAAPQNAWGFDDATLVDFLLTRVETLEQSGQPWMLSALTVGTHLPGFPDHSCPPEPGVHELLASFRCTDRQIGRLLDTLSARGVLDHTLVVITGDHAQLPTVQVQSLIGVAALSGSFAPMPLVIADPLHTLPSHAKVLSSQLDLAPTILHLLEAPPIDHSFLGYSIFGARRDHPFLVGRIGSRLAFAADAEGGRELPLAALERRCRERRPLLANARGDERAPVGPCDLRAYFDWLDGLWRAHRLAPALPGEDGGVAAELRRLRWLRYDAKEARQRKAGGDVVVDEHGAPSDNDAGDGDPGDGDPGDAVRPATPPAPRPTGR